MNDARARRTKGRGNTTQEDTARAPVGAEEPQPGVAQPGGACLSRKTVCCVTVFSANAVTFLTLTAALFPDSAHHHRARRDAREARLQRAGGGGRHATRTGVVT